MIEEDNLSTLMDLGLTLLEAKTYIALSKAETATIKTTSRIADIAKQDMYRILPRLQTLGLAEKIVAPQAMYKAVPMENGISALLQSKARAYANLQKRATKLISDFKNGDPTKPVSDDNLQFRIISERTLLLRTLDAITDNTRESIDIAHYWDFTKGMLFKHGSNILEKALKKGVKIRWITEKHEEDKQANRRIKALTRFPLFEIRYTLPPIPLRTAMYDQRDAIMGISDGLEGWVNSLWSNNRTFVHVLANYYEQLWNSSSTSNADRAV